jgi:hypothetical protein
MIVNLGLKLLTVLKLLGFVFEAFFKQMLLLLLNTFGSIVATTKLANCSLAFC